MKNPTLNSAGKMNEIAVKRENGENDNEMAGNAKRQRIASSDEDTERKNEVSGSLVESGQESQSSGEASVGSGPSGASGEPGESGESGDSGHTHSGYSGNSAQVKSVNSEPKTEGSETSAQEQAQETEVEYAQRVTRNAKSGVRDLKDMLENSIDNLCELKMHEIQLEEEMVNNGTHPDYLQGLRDIDAKFEERKREAVQRMACAVRAFEADFDAELKLANDTFKVPFVTQEAKHEAVWKLVTKLQNSIEKLREEFNVMRTDTGAFLD